MYVHTFGLLDNIVLTFKSLFNDSMEFLSLNCIIIHSESASEVTPGVTSNVEKVNGKKAMKGLEDEPDEGEKKKQKDTGYEEVVRYYQYIIM